MHNCYEYEQLFGNKFGIRSGHDDVTLCMECVQKLHSFIGPAKVSYILRIIV